MPGTEGRDKPSPYNDGVIHNRLFVSERLGLSLPCVPPLRLGMVGLLCEWLCSLRLFDLSNAEICTILWHGYGFRKAMMDIIHSGHKEAEQAEKIRHSQELRRVERLAREFALQSTIPPRTLIHPLEIPIVRSKSPHPASNQERITDFDGLEPGPDSASLIRQGTAQGRTEDLLTEDVFSHREDNVSIDEIDTLPPNMQEQLHSNWRNTPHNPAILSELDTLPTSSIQSKQTGGLPPVETQQLVAMQLPTSVRQIERPREFFLRRWGDDIRWWLLYPGRLEFLLWLIGVVVLVCLTSFFLLIITVDLRLFGSGGTH